MTYFEPRTCLTCARNVGGECHALPPAPRVTDPGNPWGVVQWPKILPSDTCGHHRDLPADLPGLTLKAATKLAERKG